MGTRHSVIAIVGGETKIAQYGQWDGYPSGQGQIILGTLLACDLKKLKSQCKKLKEITPEEHEKLWDDAYIALGKKSKHDGWTSLDVSKKFKEKNLHLNRDCGGQILQLVYDGKAKKVSLYKEFPSDSLLCEWCYVIDFDKGTFEIYNGVNKKPLKKSDRFFYLEEKSESGYHPVKLFLSYELDKLPTIKEFLEACDVKLNLLEKEYEKEQAKKLKAESKNQIAKAKQKVARSKSDNAHITLYRDDFPLYTWGDYCSIIGVSPNCEEITIPIKKSLIKAK